MLGASAMQEPGSADKIHFPIEGHSRWAVVMPAMAMGTVGGFIAIAASFGIIGTDFGAPGLALSAIALFLIVEYLVVLKLVVPRVADYGRYRIYENKVDFYPLGALGIGVKREMQSEPMEKFDGILVRPAGSGRTGFAVYLRHPQKGRTILLKNFSAMDDAQHYAQDISAALGVPVVSGV